MMPPPSRDELEAYFAAQGAPAPTTPVAPAAPVVAAPAPAPAAAAYYGNQRPQGAPTSVISPAAAAYFAQPITGDPIQTTQAVEAAAAAPAPAPDPDVVTTVKEQVIHGRPAQGAPTHHAPAAPAGPSEYRRAQDAFLGTFDQERRALEGVRDATMVRDMAHADGRAELAERQQQDQAIAHEAEIQARERDQQDMAELQQQIEDVRSRKVDPTRLMKDSGFTVASVIASMAGGFFQGLSGGRENQGLETVNRIIDRDIKLQQDDIAKDERVFRQRANLVAQNRAIFRDDQLADAATRSLYYEAIRTGLEAQAAKNGSAITRANTDSAIAILDRGQDQVNLQMQEARQRLAMARAAAHMAALEKARRHELEERAMRVKEGELAVSAEKVGADGSGLAQRFVATGQSTDGSATGYLARDKEEAKKKETQRVGSKQLIGILDEAQTIRREQGTAGRFSNRGGMIYKPEWMARLEQLEQEAITAWGHSHGLGALSDADREQARRAVGGLTDIGSSTDDRLDQARKVLTAGISVEESEAAGQVARKMVDPKTGKERIVRGSALSSSPNTARSVKRYPVKGK